MISSSPIEKHLPVFFVEQTVLDTSLWRWAALALIAIALAALSKLLTRLALLLAEPIIRRTAPNMSRGALEIFIGPLRLLLAVALFRGGVEAVGPSALVRLYFLRGLTLLFMLALFWLCAGLVDLVLGRLSVSMQVKHRTFTHSVLPLASRVTKLTILLLMITAVLGSWGYKTTTILAGLGVGGLAIALAAQKTIENLFGGVAVISDRLVSVGDFCKSGPLMGTVEDIGLRSTRLRTPDRTLLTVPNGQFSSMTIENFNKRDKILFHLMLNLRRDTTPDQVRTLLHAITDILTHHRKLEPGTLPVRFVGVGTYSLDLEVFAYVLTQDGDEFLQIQQDLLLKILDTIESAGTALALPTQASINYAVDRGRQQKGPLASQSPADSERSLSKNSS